MKSNKNLIKNWERKKDGKMANFMKKVAISE